MNDNETTISSTPGPWQDNESPVFVCREMHKDSGTFFATPVTLADGGVVAFVAFYTDTVDEDRANALLIAAAPDLLKACIDALPYLETTAAELAENSDSDDSATLANQLRAAIAKAKGGEA